ncbi:glutamine cyclotransferase [Solidesulfovibrio carbinoliphilus subsp. oakridgensis]|uniref:Glutamine cyclotransferase n=1 Tax=Solidesulfovibrio carbinoliphilus subsp. oakridgensis TaxID=694327 RepID=G7QDK8_9BACT|nr:glutaminyl-peptide cyclotransferase [Solidesulfovibrio carbinoliphilus]EHJ46514.1 glutamine cyclotransferase [Solidesulfovibrio carbinoliphilus subsp. oakridgensis]
MARFGLKRVFVAWALLAAVWCAPASARAGAPVLAAERVAALPHDAAAFTQGLLFHKDVFYESTGLYGRSSLRRVDPATGRVLARRALATQYFGEGLALVGGRLYQLTWRERRVLVAEPSDLRPAGELPLPTEGWGACSLDGALVVSDGSDRLVFYDPKDMTARGEVAVTDDGAPVPLLNELEAVAGTIWANVWGDSRIAVIDPASGRVLAWVDCASLRPGVTAADLDNVLNGIAYDPATGRIWVTGKRWPNVYEIKVPGLPVKAAR